MLMNIVTDDELLVSEVVKTILLILMITGIVINGIKLVRNGSKGIKTLNFYFLIVLFVLVFYVGKEFLVEGAMLLHPQYVEGNTIGYCSVFALGNGIEFEYEINGKKFRNCNTFYPLSKDSIKVPGGKYRVRFANPFLEKGRMDFEKLLR